MAKQHFYSRVPARASMYNRTDGFDTFAHSEGLDRFFVEREMAAVYENKLSKTDVDAVRQGKMPVVYSQSVLKSGQVVQSCVSYQSKDYTGERSAYLCHSLLMSDGELQTLHSRGNGPLNPEMFVADVSGFDFQNQSADAAYPEKAYTPSKADVPEALIRDMDPEAVKAFLFALLSALCAKGKSIFFKLPCGEETVSQNALAFLGWITTVIPYHMRKELSFVTYITDPAQYAHVKIKCMSADCPEPAKGKGIFIDLSTGLITGMPAADVVAKVPVSFFYSLLKDGGIRDEFLFFVDNAAKAMPSLEKLSVKTLSDLVFLFGGASGLFDMQTILPTDAKVYDFFAIYDKYRDALNEEYRRNVYKCLERYPQNHLAIPRNVLTKVSNLYPTDAPSAKRIAMRVVLDLIHTDIMRDKLFTFLKNNYDREDPETQSMIDMDLCSVFYGGFLQAQIAAFWSGHFAQASQTVRSAIFEKLMLSIRTPSVQGKILEFVDQNYGILSEEEKQQFYATVYEMLPEYDELAAALVPLMNRCLAVETPAYKQQSQAQLTALLEADYRKKEHNLLPLLCADHGFCYETVLQLAMGPWNSRKLYSEYLDLLTQMGVTDKTRELIYVVEVLPDNEELGGKLMLVLEQLYGPDREKANLYQWLEADALLQTELARHSQSLSYMMRTMVTQKAVAERVGDVFHMHLGTEGISVITQYAQENPYLTETPRYQQLQKFLALTEAAEENREEPLFSLLTELLTYTDLRSNMAETISRLYLKWGTQSSAVATLYEMSSNLLKKNTLFSEELYTNCKTSYMRSMQKLQSKSNNAKLAVQSAVCAAEQILGCVVVACKASDALCWVICEDAEGLQDFLRSFYGDYGNKGEKWILSQLQDAPAELVSAVKAVSAAAKPLGNSFLKKLFGK